MNLIFLLLSFCSRSRYLHILLSPCRKFSTCSETLPVRERRYRLYFTILSSRCCTYSRSISLNRSWYMLYNFFSFPFNEHYWYSFHHNWLYLYMSHLRASYVSTMLTTLLSANKMYLEVWMRRVFPDLNTIHFYGVGCLSCFFLSRLYD